MQSLRESGGTQGAPGRSALRVVRVHGLAGRADQAGDQGSHGAFPVQSSHGYVLGVVDRRASRSRRRRLLLQLRELFRHRTSAADRGPALGCARRRLDRVGGRARARRARAPRARALTRPTRGARGAMDPRRGARARVDHGFRSARERAPRSSSSALPRPRRAPGRTRRGEARAGGVRARVRAGGGCARSGRPPVPSPRGRATKSGRARQGELRGRMHRRGCGFARPARGGRAGALGATGRCTLANGGRRAATLRARLAHLRLGPGGVRRARSSVDPRVGEDARARASASGGNG